ncbi:MAG: hypothetical protein AABX08_00660 [Nanoarchaeota archaeon]
MKDFETKVVKKFEVALNSGEKEKVRALMVEIIVGLEKIVHKKKRSLHCMLGDARERCKREIKKNY